MKIGTYNVLGLKGYPPEEAIDAIGKPGEESNSAHFAQVFSQLNCDILALQEGVTVRTMQQIARQMDRYLATFPSPINWPGHILSNYPILESRTFSHADPKEKTPPFSRTCGAALLAVDDDTTLWVVDVHLHPSDIDLRIREADILQERIEKIQSVTDNIIVLGDFNSEVDERVHQNLKAMNFANAMETVGGGIQATMDTVGIRTHSIDHIYVSPPLTSHLQSAAVIRDPGFRHDGPQEKGLYVHSDHLPVVAQLKWP
ncbi:MAG: endonuclease/exonuclease/phosphatase family protein [Candidatus Latescibacteria bacterium]|jgi:endonuclease/exonuclease/phosphatase family metal-dependent hydrolase|nr:endonuclease/exonuclease/phosphatase family protein [Candidatus Latescibacterota bacterium]